MLSFFAATRQSIITCRADSSNHILRAGRVRLFSWTILCHHPDVPLYGKPYSYELPKICRNVPMKYICIHRLRSNRTTKKYVCQNNFYIIHDIVIFLLRLTRVQYQNLTYCQTIRSITLCLLFV